jgi:hypothetical protein
MISCPSCQSPHWDSGTVCTDCGRPHGKDAREKIAQDIALISAEYESKLYVPGQWFCAKCGFVQGKSFIGASTGNMWPNLATHNEPCPNDGEPMQRLTWEQHAKDAVKMWKQQVDRAVEAEAQRDALGFNKPYDCYWSRRALEAEEALSNSLQATQLIRAYGWKQTETLQMFLHRLTQISQGNSAAGKTKGQNSMKRNLLLDPNGADGNGPAETPKQPVVTTPRTAIVAKMKCYGPPQRNGSHESVSLSAVYAETGVNKEWATATPSGSLSLSIDNPSAQGFIQADKEYIVTIREAQPGE